MDELGKKSQKIRLSFRDCIINFLEPGVFKAAAASGVISNGNQNIRNIIFNGQTAFALRATELFILVEEVQYSDTERQILMCLKDTME